MMRETQMPTSTNKQFLPNVAQQVFDTPLAILPEKLSVILRALGPRLTLDPSGLAELVAGEQLRSNNPDGSVFAWSDDEDFSVSNRKPYKVTEDGVAMIPVQGVLMKKSSWMSAMSGCSSYQSIGLALATAMDDSSVKGIILDIDSPGGSTHGCFELANQIFYSRGKGKPIYAAANDCACSAAYAIAAACDKVYVTMTGAVGSIGVYCVHCDQSAADEKAGLSYEYIKFGAKKAEGNPHTALSKSARADLQAEINRQGDIFVSAVAKYRGLSTEAVAGTEAGVMSAGNSLPDYADAVGTLDDCYSAITKKLGSTSGVTIIGSMQTKPVSAETELVPALAVAVPAAGMPEEECTKPAPEPDDAEPDEDEDDNEENKKMSVPVTDPAAQTAATPTPAAAPAPVPVAAAPAPAPNDAVAISTLCKIAGKPELIGDFIINGTSAADVQKFLLDASATAPETEVNSQVNTASTSAVDTLETQAVALSKSAKITKAAAYVQVMGSNPDLYANYLGEREEGTNNGTAKNNCRYIQGLYARLGAPVGITA